MHAVLYAALFFGTSDDDACDPDLAVKQLEGIAWSLRQLSPSEQEEFRRYAFDAAKQDPSTDMAHEIRALVNGLLPLDHMS